MLTRIKKEVDFQVASKIKENEHINKEKKFK